MARMHTKKHGKSKSRKPVLEMVEKPSVSADEAQQAILGYAKQSMHQARIGQVLKEKHGIKYSKDFFGKRLGRVLEDSGVKREFPQDMADLMRKAIRLRKHITRNHNDVHNKAMLARTESKIWRLTKYYKREGRLPEGWKYDPEKIALVIKG